MEERVVVQPAPIGGLVSILVFQVTLVGVAHVLDMTLGGGSGFYVERKHPPAGLAAKRRVPGLVVKKHHVPRL